MQPHLIIYDVALELLECHCVEPGEQSLIARLGLSLSLVQLCQVVSSSSIVIACKTNIRGSVNGFNLFEWTPSKQRLLQARLETDHIAGINGSFQKQSWSVIFTDPNQTGAVRALGSAIMSNTFDSKAPQLTMHITAICPQYKQNVKYVFLSLRHQASFNNSDQPSHIEEPTQMWVQTQSNELAFFQRGSLQWSTALPTSVEKIFIAECQVPDKLSQLCLLVRFDETLRVYNSITGGIIKDLSITMSDFIISDVRELGVKSIVIINNGELQSDEQCLIYPETTISTVATPVKKATHEDITRAKTNMDHVLMTLGQQIEHKREQIGRLRTSLTSKSEIIQECQDLMTGPLQSMFLTGGGSYMSIDGTFGPEDMTLFRRKREHRRKQVLKRLVHIIGSGVDTNFLQKEDQYESNDGDVAPHGFVDILECVSGSHVFIEDNLVWVGVRVKNMYESPIFNVRLSVLLQNSCGQSISELGSQANGLLVCTISIESSALEDSEYFDKSSAVRRILSNGILLHFDRKSVQSFDVDIPHRTVLITRFSIVDQYPSIWRPYLVLHAKTGCRLDNISLQRLSILLQDGLRLSHGVDSLSFGSLEEGVIALIYPRSGMVKLNTDHTSWNVIFKARTEALAINYARRTVLLCSRFA
ncbi:hypothetical protein BX616_004147 [Lobosporangium transversale]|nr:hypothetical protein BX616_004147 [Lobosporangium transversale]